jgi:hypothetical protein
MADNFAELTNRLAAVDFFGKAGEEMPRGAELSSAVKRAVPLLPPVYISAYGEPLEAAVGRLTAAAPHRSNDGRDAYGRRIPAQSGQPD